MLGLVVCLALFTGCKKKDPDAVPLGDTGLSIDVSDRKDKILLVTDKGSGIWDVSADGNGLTTVYVKDERGMPTESSLETTIKEENAIGNTGSVTTGKDGLLILTIKRTHCASCTPEKPQYFVTSYVPTADGAARCEGWSEESGSDDHLTVCRRLMSSTKPGAITTAPKGGTAPTPAAPPTAPAPPKP